MHEKSIVIKFISILIFLSGVGAYTQTSFEMKKCQIKKSNLKNWKTSSFLDNEKRQFKSKESNVLQFVGSDKIKLTQKSTFVVNPSQVYTVSYDLYYTGLTSSDLKGFYISLIYKDKTRGLIDSKLMTVDSLACDTLIPGNWYTFRKSFHMDQKQQIKLSLSFNDVALKFLEIRNLEVTNTPISNFFHGINYVLNGGFELHYKIPSNTYSGFNEVSFWQITSQPQCVYSRYDTNAYSVDRTSYINGVNTGSPDLVTNDLSFKYNDLNIPEGHACARYHCPYYKRNSSEETGGEYIQTMLKKSLIQGKTYELSMMLRLSEESRYTINNFGAFFSECALNVFDNLMIEQKVHMASAILLKKYLVKEDGWLKVSVFYTATGGEKYLTLGCFDSQESLYEPKAIRSCNSCSQIGGPIILVDDIKLIEIQD